MVGHPIKSRSLAQLYCVTELTVSLVEMLTTIRNQTSEKTNSIVIWFEKENTPPPTITNTILPTIMLIGSLTVNISIKYKINSIFQTAIYNNNNCCQTFLMNTCHFVVKDTTSSVQ